MKSLLSKTVNISRSLDPRTRGPFASQSGVCYVAPAANWAADTVGGYVTQGVRDYGLLNAVLVTRADIANYHRQVLHFGTLGDFVASSKSPCLRRNKVVATIFHGDRYGDNPTLSRSIELLLSAQERVDVIVTGCRIMEQRLIVWGVPPHKVVRIPLGVDLSLFRPCAQPVRRLAIRRQLGVPEGVFCIGSFQKDGDGWGEGMSPKWIKGPDVFLETLAKLRESLSMFVLLTGPARGFVKKGLERLGIPYKHAVLDDYREIAAYYQALDLYLVTSREDGAPAALLESFASGVPLVSTRVGMVPDIAIDGVNAFCADSEDVVTLAESIRRLAGEPGLAQRLVAAATETIQANDWPLIAKAYQDEVYLPLLGRL